MIKKLIIKNWVNTILFSLLIIIANFAIYNIMHVLLVSVHVEQKLAEVVGRLISCTCMLIFFYKVFDIKDFGLKNSNFLKGLFIGGLMFLDIINIMAGTLIQLSDYKVVMPSLYLISILIVEEIFIGIFEEFLFRGIILNTLLIKMNSSTFISKIAAIIISSVLFGIVHLLNLFDNPDLINDTIAQVFYSVFIGIFFGALYLRTKNIWVVVFYHIMYNSASEIPVIFFNIPNQTVTDSTISDALLNILVSSIYMFAGFFIARKLRDTRDIKSMKNE